MKKGYLLVLIVTIAAIGIYVGCGSNAVPTVPGPTLARFVSSSVCVTCHQEIGAAWEETGHFRALDDLLASDHARESCIPCHTTGNDGNTGNSGYDDPDPAVQAKFEGVQCEECHSAGGDHIQDFKPLPTPLGSFVCGECHDSAHHPQYTEWSKSLHAVSLNARDKSSHFGTECLRCHSADYIFADSIPEGATPFDFNLSIECVVCHDPHNAVNEFQLRAEPKELCGQCHNDEEAVPGESVHHSNVQMFEGAGGYEYPGRTYTNTYHTLIEDACAACHMYTAPFNADMGTSISGHSFEPVIEACQECHPGLETFDRDGKQTEIKGLLAELKEELDAATAQDKGLVSYINAKFNYDFCNNEGSYGIHNYKYAKALLEDSIADFEPGSGGPPPPEATYVGSSACSTCHSNTYNAWLETGHRNILRKVVGGVAPVYPFTSVPNPPPGYTWNDITYVLGGASWTAYFLNSEGFRIRGDEVAWHVHTQEWGASGTPGTFSEYTCGNCHTVGWQSFDDNGGVHQDGLAGIAGTFDEPGMGCERCHGYGSNHIAGPNKSNIDKDSSSEFCGECHSSGDHVIMKDNLVKTHSHYDMFKHGTHGDALTCGDCHDVHATAIHDEESSYVGIVKDCTDCHSAASHQVTGPMASLDCRDCHMPLIAAEGHISFPGTLHEAGDEHGHIFGIDTTGIALDGGYLDTDGTTTWIKEDAEGKVKLNLAWACMQCHNGEDAFEITDYNVAKNRAIGMHD